MNGDLLSSGYVGAKWKYDINFDKKKILKHFLHGNVFENHMQNVGYFIQALTHWGRVMHICISKLTIIGSDNGLSPRRRQAIIWTKLEYC